MKYRYSKFTGEDLDDVDLEDLLSRLSDLLLSSGFDSPYGLPYDDDSPVTRCSRCTTRSSRQSSMAGCSPRRRSRSCSAKTGSNRKMRKNASTISIRRIIDKLQHQGYLTGAPES